MAENAEIASLRQQLEQLNKDIASPKKMTVDDLRRQVAEKKEFVAALRGNTRFHKNKELTQTTKLSTKSDNMTILTLKNQNN